MFLISVEQMAPQRFQKYDLQNGLSYDAHVDSPFTDCEITNICQIVLAVPHTYRIE